jgi:acetylglutamate kinase
MLRVVKIGGRAQHDPRLSGALASCWRAAPGALCVVHGGGDEITALQRRLELPVRFDGGRRITTSEDLQLVRMVLSGLVNKRLVAALRAAGAPAVGVSGEDGGLLEALVTDEGRLGRVGTAPSVNPELLRTLLAGPWLPVISPVAAERGREDALNVNGDDAAAALAASLGAGELLFVSDVPAVVEQGTCHRSLQEPDIDRLLATRAAEGGMRAKLEAARAALRQGVRRVRIGDLTMLHELEAGTLLRATAAEATA